MLTYFFVVGQWSATVQFDQIRRNFENGATAVQYILRDYSFRLDITRDWM